MDSWDGGSQHKEGARAWSTDSALLLSAAAHKGTASFPLLSRSWGWDAENRDVEFAAEGPARLYGGWLLLCVE